MARDSGRIPKSEPLAFFLTWTTYGTWVPGDERGWVAKPGAFCQPDPALEDRSRSRMTEPALTLDDRQRQIVEGTIEDHCKVRGWHLHAVACRTNHVHVVVTAHTRHPEEVMDQFKAWCSRRLKELGNDMGADVSRKARSNWWTQRGSRRWINDEQSLAEAIAYVLEGQDRPQSKG
jgi:REP element-mobilizing transposase RayT